MKAKGNTFKLIYGNCRDQNTKQVSLTSTIPKSFLNQVKNRMETLLKRMLYKLVSLPMMSEFKILDDFLPQMTANRA
jgi:hypothetical protein